MINVKSESFILTRHALITEIRIVLRTIISVGVLLMLRFSGVDTALGTDYRCARVAGIGA